MRGAPTRDPELTEGPDREAVGEPHPAPKGTAPEPKAGEHRKAATDEAVAGTEARMAGDRVHPDEGQAEAPASQDDEATAGPEDAPAYAEGSALTAYSAEAMATAQGQASPAFSPKIVV